MFIWGENTGVSRIFRPQEWARALWLLAGSLAQRLDASEIARPGGNSVVGLGSPVVPFSLFFGGVLGSLSKVNSHMVTGLRSREASKALKGLGGSSRGFGG